MISIRLIRLSQCRLSLWLAVTAFCALLTPFSGASGAGGSVAFVLHPDVNVDNLSLNQLRKVLLAEQQYWPDRSKIVLLIREQSTIERQVVLERIYQMTEDEYRRYWIAKMFRAEIPYKPRKVQSANMARELVSVIPSSITFMASDDVAPGHRVVKVDGKLPGEDGYPLNY